MDLSKKANRIEHCSISDYPLVLLRRAIEARAKADEARRKAGILVNNVGGVFTDSSTDALCGNKFRGSRVGEFS